MLEILKYVFGCIGGLLGWIIFLHWLGIIDVWGMLTNCARGVRQVRDAWHGHDRSDQ